MTTPTFPFSSCSAIVAYPFPVVPYISSSFPAILAQNFPLGNEITDFLFGSMGTQGGMM